MRREKKTNHSTNYKKSIFLLSINIIIGVFCVLIYHSDNGNLHLLLLLLYLEELLNRKKNYCAVTKNYYFK